MGIFYNSPQPPTASNSGTPPEPHVPIGTQGSAPPRRSIAVLMLAVLASWPADLEPRLTRPNEQLQKIAPLTLTYGQQPAQIGTSRQTYQTAVSSWPLDLEPRLEIPNNRRQTIAPLTLTYGSPPTIVGASAIDAAIRIGQWPPDLEPRLGSPNNARVSVAPLTLAYGQQPAPTPALTVPELQALTAPLLDWPAQSAPKSLAWLAPPSAVPYVAFPYGPVLASWLPDLEPRLTRPNDHRQKIAPLTLPTGAPPPPPPALNASAFQSIAAWSPLDWPAQTAPRSTAWTQLPSAVPYVPYPYGLALSTWPSDLEPRLTRPNERRQTIAPLTLPTGSTPPPQPPLAVLELLQIVSTWPSTWDAQTAAKNAAWNVPPVLVQVPYAPLPVGIWTAWQPPWVSPPIPVAIATLTLPTGQTPPGAASPALRLIYAWPPDPTTIPRAQGVAALIPPPPPLVVQVPANGLPALIWTAWVESFVRPPSPVAIAPLTLPTGQAPPLITTGRVTFALLVGASWPADLEPRLGLPNNAQQKIAPLTRVYGSQPSPRPPLSVSTLHIISTWAQSWDAQAPPRIVTLTLQTGSQPPVRGSIDRQVMTVPTWIPPFSLPQRLATAVPPTFFDLLDAAVIVRVTADAWMVAVSADPRNVQVSADPLVLLTDADGRIVQVFREPFIIDPEED